MISGTKKWTNHQNKSIGQKRRIWNIKFVSFNSTKCLFVTQASCSSGKSNMNLLFCRIRNIYKSLNFISWLKLKLMQPLKLWIRYNQIFSIMNIISTWREDKLTSVWWCSPSSWRERSPCKQLRPGWSEASERFSEETQDEETVTSLMTSLISLLSDDWIIFCWSLWTH